MVPFVTLGLQFWRSKSWQDNDYKMALNNCYEALCHNQHNAKPSKCPLKLDDVGAVIFAYITYFASDEMRAKTKDARYYADEYSDRKDPYRVGLVALITKGAKEYNKSITEEFTNDVLRYLYWAIKRDKCPWVILHPRDEVKFRVKNWQIKEPYRSIASISENICNLMIKVFKLVMKAIEVVIDGLDSVLDLTKDTLSCTAWLLKHLPYVLGGGVVLLAGIQIYSIKKNGKFYGEDLVKKRMGL
jgi:hypothetical protein